jgi:hypothetical protein
LVAEREKRGSVEQYVQRWKGNIGKVQATPNAFILPPKLANVGSITFEEGTFEAINAGFWHRSISENLLVSEPL